MNTAFARSARFVWLAAAACGLAACSKEAPAPAPAAPAAVSEPSSSPLPGVVGTPSDMAASGTPTAPNTGNTAVGGLTTHPEHGAPASGGAPSPTGGDAAPGHPASSASQ
jgi:hypothetical protein